MALRSNLALKKHKKKHLGFIKYLIGGLLVLLMLLVGGILYFNGENIKAPLISFLKERTSLSINCKEIEFSPLYPNIIKLKDITVNKSHIDEIYAEFDLGSLIKSDNLEFKYLYLKNAKMDENDLNHIEGERFGFFNFEIKKLELVDSPITLFALVADNATANLDDVSLNQKGQLTFSKGTIQVKQGTIDGYEIKDLYAKVSDDPERRIIENFSTKIYGGIVSGSFSVNKQTDEINFQSLNIKSVILKDHKQLANKYAIKAPVVSIANSVLAIPSSDIYFGQLSGKMSNLEIRNDSLEFVFNGKSGEISKPKMGISTDSNTISTRVDNNRITLKIHGKYINTDFDLFCKYKKNNEDDKYRLLIDKLSLSNGRIDLTDNIVNNLHSSLFALDTRIENLKISDVEFVSNIDVFPLTVKEFNLNGRNIIFSSKDKYYISTGIFSVDLNSGYYRDLFFKELKLKSKITSDNTLFNLENVTFNTSSASGIYNYNNKNNTLIARLKANDFDVTELNSDLIKRLVNGKVNVNLELNTKDSSSELSSAPVYTGISNDYLKKENLMLRLIGKLSIESKQLFISGFGLDLLNGGKEGSYTFEEDNLLEALKESDCGLYKLSMELNINNGLAKLNGKTELTSSSVKTYGSYDLLSDNLDLHALLRTFTKGNISAFHITGKTNAPVYTLKALKRDEVRTGLTVVPKLKEEDLEQKVTEEKQKDTSVTPPSSTVVEDNVQLSEDTISNSEETNSIEQPKAEEQTQSEDDLSTDKSDTKENENKELDDFEKELLQ